jgi:formylmethanofuran dehydrogenase subunit E
LSFRYQNVHLEILELLGAYRERRDSSSVLYLVRTGDQVYALCADMSKSSQGRARGRWVLRFRVREPQEEPVLVDFQLKRIADFHGHLCPELVIGYRACQCALPRLQLELFAAPGLRVLVENTTPAVDAIQHVTGCTTGNGRLVARDDGKHAYTFINGDGEGIRLSLKANRMLFDPEFLALEARIQAEQATLWEVARYQALVDERIVTLLHLDEEALFDVQPTSAAWPADNITSALVPCSRCGELTATTHLVLIERRRVCLACAKVSS